MFPRHLSAALFVLLAATPVAGEQSFAIVFGAAKNDGGFNEAAVRAVERLRAEHNISLRERLSTDAPDIAPILRQLIAKGATEVLTLSFASVNAVKTVAPEHPETRFTVIDAVAEGPNIRSVTFREDHAAFLVGAAAGFATLTGRVGFIGAVPFPPIRRFGCGFVQGVEAARPDVVVDWRYFGDGPAAFRDSVTASATASRMVAEGADVIFQAAGHAGLAAMSATVAGDALAIGVDVNQNGIFPGEVLTSALKDVETAVYQSWSDAIAGTWAPGVVRLGLAEGGVDWAVDTHNQMRVAPFRQVIDTFAAEIRAGARAVAAPDDRTDCPAA